MDELYIGLILRGDVSKYSYFVEKYKGMAFSIAFRIVNNKEDAEEIVQDAFLKAFKSLNKFRRDSKFSTWFYRIVVNTSLSRVRNKTPESSNLGDDEIGNTMAENVESAYHSLDLSERKTFIQNALEELSIEDRLLLTLHYLNENSVEEITEITDITRDNVKTKLHRARNRLYKVMNKKLKAEVQSIL
ncbi:MAG TPA: sigma-70 family RNA polymerase sigma factor [Candidatus Acidoferrales bacterium]|nr:sigma-70 family RNA polymerase sigma factor [Candidatus Acidoferrales bacterium]